MGQPIESVDPLFELSLESAGTGARPSARSLYRQLRAAIVDGRLSPGARLPATRLATAVFGVSRNTAAEVYDRLLVDGYVVTRRGSGTFVAARRFDEGAAQPHGSAADDPRINPLWLRADLASAVGFWHEPARGATTSSTPVRIDFRPALIDARLFPVDVLRRVSAAQWRAVEKAPARYRSPQGNQGHFPLRDAIVRHIASTRAITCTPDDVIVTSGAQQAFDLVARVLVTPGRSIVAVEDPGYPPMRVPFIAAGATIVPVPVDDEGLRVDRLPPAATIVCVCPSHQFPLGVTMSAGRRDALVAHARAHGAVIVEDDYDGEFRFDGHPLSALRTAAASDVVFYVGTFSKCMLPSLRLGFAIVPRWARRAMVTAKNGLDWHSSLPTQMAVARFIADGHLSHHVRRMRIVYRQRRRLLTTLLGDLAPRLAPLPSAYGMHVAAVASGAIDLDRIATALAEDGIHVHTLQRYFLGKPDRVGMVLGYGAVDLPQVAEGIAALRRALDGVR